jgi:uncharacterized protein YecT (DUF1311 family)
MLLFLLLAMLSDPELPSDPCLEYTDYEVTVPKNFDAQRDAHDLAEKFANGEGVKRDFAAALHFLCVADGLAPAEQSGMIQHVMAMKRGETRERLDYCEFITSGHGSYVCALRREETLRPELRARYEAVRRSAGKPLDALRARADTFIEADATWETEQTFGGTIYASMGVNTRLDGEQTFVELLEQYTKKRAPAASASDYQRADADLNAAYRERMSGAAECDPEHCDKDNLRTAQRAWIIYRDAWIAFYQDRWRGTASPEALRLEIGTALARVRISDLGNI